jgi:hypothetical protein
MKLRPTSRRAFLQGAFGSMLAIPFLPSLQSTKASAQAAESPPLRFAFIGSVFGRDIDYWYPADPTAQTQDGVHHTELSSLLGPISHTIGESFDPIRNKFSILRGLDSMQFGDGHGPSVALTASGMLQSGPGFGYSLDAVLEESTKFYPTLPQLGAMRTSPNSELIQLSFSYSALAGPGQPLWHEWDPSVVYEKYFNPVTLARAEARNLYKRGIVNLVIDDFRKVTTGERIGREDRRKLDNYMTLLADAERRLGISTAQCGDIGTPPDGFPSAEDMHSAVFNMEVAALACGMTKIVTHNIHHYNSASLLSADPGHGEAHVPTPAGDVTQHALNNKWVMERVAEFLNKLDAVEESNGTLLDNTVFLYGNTEARGFHILYDMPVIVAGGGGKLRTGQYIDYRPRPLTFYDEATRVYAGRPYNNLLVSLFQALGLEDPADYEKFGQKGFGAYTYRDKLELHYAPFMDRNAALPFLLT